MREREWRSKWRKRTPNMRGMEKSWGEEKRSISAHRERVNNHGPSLNMLFYVILKVKEIN